MGTKEKAQLIVMSHLSDAQQLAGMKSYASSTRKLQLSTRTIEEINFAKFLIMYTGGDLTQEVDPDEMWEKFLQR